MIDRWDLLVIPALKMVLPQVINDYVKDLNDELLDADSSRIFVTHSIRSQEILDNVRNYLESLNYFDEIIFTDAGGVISSHCGPGTLGLLFITK